MDMTLSTLPSEVLLKLEAKVRAMTEAANDKVGIAHFYMDGALITDMKRVWIRGREAIEQYWAAMPAFQEWQLQILETGATRKLLTSGCAPLRGWKLTACRQWKWGIV